MRQSQVWDLLPAVAPPDEDEGMKVLDSEGECPGKRAASTRGGFCQGTHQQPCVS